MLPIKLTIEGLYSYKEKQVIDFESLTSSWLFGIFGKVGSGKSSIIDAITLAVYGEVERLGQRDNKNYNLMNLDSKELFINFICKVNGDKYSFIYHSKKTRNGKKVNTPERKISIYKEEEWIPVDKSGEDILNISYRNFKQAVVIPQGKFQEFISQAPTDRTEMLSEIFNLEKYDLSYKIKHLREKSNLEVTRIEGLLSGIPNVNEDELNSKNIEIINAKKDISIIKKEVEVLELSKTKISKAKEIFKEYNYTVEMFEENKILKKGLARIEEKIFFFENIKPLIMDKNKFLSKLQKNNDDLSNLKEVKKNNELKLLEINSNLEDLALKENNIKNKVIFKNDFHNILQINKINKEFDEINSEKINSDINLIKYKKILKEIEESKNNLEEKKEVLESKLDNNDLILDISQWHLDKNHLIKKMIDLKKKKEKIEGVGANLVFALDSEGNKLKELEGELEEISGRGFALDSKEGQPRRATRTGLEGKIAELRVNQKLSLFSDGIKDGGACPLCGSEHHPKILKIESVDNELKLAEKELKLLKKQIKKYEKINSEIEIINSELSNNANDLKKVKENIKKLNKEIDDLTNNFKWSERYKEKKELEKLKNENKKKREEIKKLKNAITQYLQKRDTIIDKIQKIEIFLSELKVNLEFKEKEKNKYLKLLVKLNSNDYLDALDEKILNYIDDYEIEINAYNNELEKNNKNKNKIEQDIKISQAKMPRILENIDELSEELLVINNKLKSQMGETHPTEHGFGTPPKRGIDQIETLMNENFNLKANKEKVEEIKRKYNYLKTRLSELIEKKTENLYIEIEDEENKENLSIKKAKAEELNKEISKLESEFKIDKENLEKNRKSNEERNIIIKRYDNLVSLEKLFKGKKFVQFVADFYLKNLIYNANKRFVKLTKHQLSLDIDEKSNFIVKDHLNSGRVRLLKTLSGGQTFQASFCIALALAESINTINKQEENFFFIDEGFGSLDKDSLSLVFNTLNSLRYEQRIVGVISHVEDFKREVDVSITVKRDKKHGSVVNTSW